MTDSGVVAVEADEVGTLLQMFVANQIRKTWGHENGDISGTISQNDLVF